MQPRCNLQGAGWWEGDPWFSVALGSPTGSPLRAVAMVTQGRLGAEEGNKAARPPARLLHVGLLLRGRLPRLPAIAAAAAAARAR